jgi:protein-disulfide isomerase
LKDDLRSGLLGFLFTFSAVSLSLNLYFLWLLKKPAVLEYISRYRTPAAVSASDHVRGPADATVTLIEYADFQCSFCEELHASLKELSKKEKFRWVFRHFPLESHKLSERYAEASECASEQGRFWEFADALYEHPLKQGSIENLTAEAYREGLNPNQFTRCVENKITEDKVLSQKREGERLWIDATPTFFVNGRRYVGALPVEDLEKALAH